MKGLGKRLRAGVPRLMIDGTVQMLGAGDQIVDVIQLQRLTDTGPVYERLVGLNYEMRGYAVDYRGLLLGVRDGGIDLIATKEGMPNAYIQCKAGRLGKQSVEKLLYAADCYFQRVHPLKGSLFVLAVPSLAGAFAARKKVHATGRISTHYPLASYFLSKNQPGFPVRVSIAEIPLPIEDLSGSASPAVNEM